MALTGQSKPSSSEERDPIEEARDTTRKLMADEIINTSLATKRAEREEAEAKAAKAKVERERAESGGGLKQEPAFKVTGEVDLGHINYQEMLAAQAADLKQLKQEAEEQASRQAAVSDDLREKLHSKEMELIQTSFQAQMQNLTKLIESNASKGSFFEQYEAAKVMAAQLGYVAPSTNISDLNTQIELKKMEFENTRALRQMARDEKRSDREYQLELRRFDDERDARRVNQARQEKRDEMFMNAPKIIGGAIAKGLVESGGKGGSSAGAVGQKPGHYNLEADVGDAGEVGCPACQQPIGIGPTARKAVCANCGTTVSIKRTPAGVPPVETQPEEE